MPDTDRVTVRVAADWPSGPRIVRLSSRCPVSVPHRAHRYWADFWTEVRGTCPGLIGTTAAAELRLTTALRRVERRTARRRRRLAARRDSRG